MKYPEDLVTAARCFALDSTDSNFNKLAHEIDTFLWVPKSHLQPAGDAAFTANLLGAALGAALAPTFMRMLQDKKRPNPPPKTRPKLRRVK